MSHHLSRRNLLTAAVATGALSACGFKLRGSERFAFSRIAIISSAGDGAVAQELRGAFPGSVQVLNPDTPTTQAQVVLHISGEQREKLVVGTNASGQVRELQLRLQIRFSVRTPQGSALMPEDSIALQRDLSFNESAALAKEAEEAQLYRDMRHDIVHQILRRLATLKPDL